MNEDIEPILIGDVDDLEIGSVENFEHDEINYAIFRIESGFFATQGNCNCGERSLLSEADVDGEELECPSCGNTFSIVSGDSISDLDQAPLKIYDVIEEENQIFLSI